MHMKKIFWTLLLCVVPAATAQADVQSQVMACASQASQAVEGTNASEFEDGLACLLHHADKDNGKVTDPFSVAKVLIEPLKTDAYFLTPARKTVLARAAFRFLMQTALISIKSKVHVLGKTRGELLESLKDAAKLLEKDKKSKPVALAILYVRMSQKAVLSLKNTDSKVLKALQATQKLIAGAWEEDLGAIAEGAQQFLGLAKELAGKSLFMEMTQIQVLHSMVRLTKEAAKFQQLVDSCRKTKHETVTGFCIITYSQIINENKKKSGSKNQINGDIEYKAYEEILELMTATSRNTDTVNRTVALMAVQYIRYTLPGKMKSVIQPYLHKALEKEKERQSKSIKRATGMKRGSSLFEITFSQEHLVYLIFDLMQRIHEKSKTWTPAQDMLLQKLLDMQLQLQQVQQQLNNLSKICKVR